MVDPAEMLDEDEYEVGAATDLPDLFACCKRTSTPCQPSAVNPALRSPLQRVSRPGSGISHPGSHGFATAARAQQARSKHQRSSTLA